MLVDVINMDINDSTNGDWARNWKLLLIAILNLIIQFRQSSGHGTTAHSCHVHNCDLIGLLFFYGYI